MKIHSLTFEGAKGFDLRSIVRDIEAVDLGYKLDCSDEYIREVIQDAFQNHGYFKAGVTEPRCTVFRRDPHEMWIDVRACIQPGAIFRLKEILFSRSSVLTPEELREQVPMRDGDLFRIDVIRTGLNNLREIYCRIGYVNSTPVPNIQIDEVSKTISVLFDFDEGEKFSYGDLVIEGEESVSGARQRLSAAWQAYQGKPYDCGASLESFLHDIHALPNIKPNEVFRQSFDKGTNTVTVGITLVKPLQAEVVRKR